jgi:CRISPR-associated protein Cmr2
MVSALLNARARLAARLHDPPEKALILMRTRAGHEAGTTRTLLADLFPAGIGHDLEAAMKKADRWASAADRAAFPNEVEAERWPAWQQVRFAERPVVIHPLTGVAHELQTLARDIDPVAAQVLGTEHLRSLIQKDGAHPDPVRTALALWRFGSELPGELANLWRQLPADSRVPDHTIHDHLDLTAALAGSFVGGSEPALLGVSIGPVQEFIAAARSTSDLWAGSHLLSRLAWEAMRVVCERCGPEAVIFPRLRGIPQVDMWLQRDMQVDAGLFEECAWRTTASDANPLFAAALPNRFTALVPSGMVEQLTGEMTSAVRGFAQKQAHRAFIKLLDAIDEPAHQQLHGWSQIDRQLAGFPEVHWASVPWSLAIDNAAAGDEVSSGTLAEAMRPFMGAHAAPGFLGHPAWKLLSRGVEIDKGWFWKPNPGALYPALHGLLDRALNAAKGTRVFNPVEQVGWRCALTGETEWITLHAHDLVSSYRTRNDTLWGRVASRKPSWARPGEHLGALPMLKRLWPELFVEEIAALMGQSIEVRRYVVSTHTMAMASSLLSAANPDAPAQVPAQIVEAVRRAKPPRVALPRKLSSALFRHPQGETLRLIPAWLENMLEDEVAVRETDDGEPPPQAQEFRRLMTTAGLSMPDSYYGLLMLDGDRMGAWLSADPTLTRPIRDSFHPQIQQALDSRFGSDATFRLYANAQRPPNPAWHMAISEALNHFALLRAPAVIEDQFLGRVIYAGGDDVLAMLAASDLMAAAAALRAAYSGLEGDRPAVGSRLFGGQGNGWALHGGRVLRLMGSGATASCGLVVAHHQSPLTGVLKSLREAEQRAKNNGGRNAWSLTLLKRSGGQLQVTAKWAHLPLFEELRDFLGSAGVSRRAAYNVLDWFADVPGEPTLIEAMLRFRMQRQSQTRNAREAAVRVAKGLVDAAFDRGGQFSAPEALDWLKSFMLAAEFMAREVRYSAGSNSGDGDQP